MRTTLTIRTDERLRRALEQRARAQGRTVSALAREILEEALEERPLAQRTGHLQGRLKLGREVGDAWRTRLRQHNWRE